MNLLNAMAQAAKGMKAQGVRMRVISENIANADTTAKTPGGDPYRRKTVNFKNVLDRALGVNVVEANKIGYDNSEFALKFDPNHPAADKNGYIKTSNVNPLIEMMDMREAQRTYEANLGVIDISRNMLMRTLDMLAK